MAFQTESSAAASTVKSGNFEQALGFINIGLPNTHGELSKFGMVPLKASSASEQGLFTDLNAGTAEQQAEILQWVKDNIVLTFRPNTSGAKAISFGYKKAA